MLISISAKLTLRAKIALIEELSSKHHNNTVELPDWVSEYFMPHAHDEVTIKIGDMPIAVYDTVTKHIYNLKIIVAELAAHPEEVVKLMRGINL